MREQNGPAGDRVKQRATGDFLILSGFVCLLVLVVGFLAGRAVVAGSSEKPMRQQRGRRWTRTRLRVRRNTVWR